MILLSQTLKRQALTNAAQSSFKTIVTLKFIARLRLLHFDISWLQKPVQFFSADEKENQETYFHFCPEQAAARTLINEGALCDNLIALSDGIQQSRISNLYRFFNNPKYIEESTRMLGPHYHLKSTNVAIDTVVIRSKTTQPKGQYSQLWDTFSFVIMKLKPT